MADLDAGERRPKEVVELNGVEAAPPLWVGVGRVVVEGVQVHGNQLAMQPGGSEHRGRHHREIGEELQRWYKMLLFFG